MAGPDKSVGGIDPSLTSCGVTVLGSYRSSSIAASKGITTLPLQDRIPKIGDLAGAALDLLFDLSAANHRMSGWPALVLIEAPDVSRSYGGLVERIGLTHQITADLLWRGVQVGWVPSPVLKGYATGKGGGKIDGVEVKQVVLRRAQQLWPDLGIASTDQADSAFLAAMAADVLGLGRVVPDSQAAEWLYRDSIQYPEAIRAAVQ